MFRTWQPRSRPPVTVVSGLNAEAAERRQLTVMFCDLVGSTALAARLGWFRYHIESEDSPAAACALTCRPGGDGSSSRVGPAEAVLRMKQ